jgi:hypothetical protein
MIGTVRNVGYKFVRPAAAPAAAPTPAELPSRPGR